MSSEFNCNYLDTSIVTLITHNATPVEQSQYFIIKSGDTPANISTYEYYKTLNTMSSSIFEILMLICFAISWPISIIKALRTKVVAGKSPLFMAIIIVGYIFGIIHKIINGFDYVTFLWMFNTLLVSVDLMLYFKYRNNRITHQ